MRVLVLNSGSSSLKRRTWAHCLIEVARLLHMPCEKLLDPREMQALNGETSPHGVIVPGSAEEGDRS